MQESNLSCFHFISQFVPYLNTSLAHDLAIWFHSGNKLPASDAPVTRNKLERYVSQAYWMLKNSFNDIAMHHQPYFIYTNSFISQRFIAKAQATINKWLCEWQLS